MMYGETIRTPQITFRYPPPDIQQVLGRTAGEDGCGITAGGNPVPGPSEIGSTIAVDAGGLGGL